MRRTLAAAALLTGLSLAAPPDFDRAREQVRKLREGDTDAWRRVPWAASLLDAADAARRERRPMFVFTLDGNLDTGRC